MFLAVSVFDNFLFEFDKTRLPAVAAGCRGDVKVKNIMYEVRTRGGTGMAGFAWVTFTCTPPRLILSQRREWKVHPRDNSTHVPPLGFFHSFLLSSSFRRQAYEEVRNFSPTRKDYFGNFFQFWSAATRFFDFLIRHRLKFGADSGWEM